MNILLTGGGGAGALPLFQSWSRKHTVHLADADPHRIDPAVPSKRRHAIPKATDPLLCSVVHDLVRDHDIELVIPAVDEELPVLETLRLFERIPFLMPDQWFVTVMLDKFGSIRALRERGIPVPYTKIMKPRYGHGSRGVTVEQEHVTGVEYTVQMMADRQGTLRAVVPVRVKQKRGITVHGITDDQPDVIRACEAIHDAVGSFGTYNVQGVLAGSQFLPFEINPRISTTTCLAVEAGADPLAIWNGDVTERVRFTVGLTLRRYWNTVIT